VVVFPPVGMCSAPPTTTTRMRKKMSKTTHLDTRLLVS
jgi:hypothetical protein